MRSRLVRIRAKDAKQACRLVRTRTNAAKQAGGWSDQVSETRRQRPTGRTVARPALKYPGSDASKRCEAGRQASKADHGSRERLQAAVHGRRVSRSAELALDQQK